MYICKRFHTLVHDNVNRGLRKISKNNTRNFIKKKPQNWCFPVNTLKFLRKAFPMEHLRWLFLHDFNCEAMKQLGSF